MNTRELIYNAVVLKSIDAKKPAIVDAIEGKFAIQIRWCMSSLRNSHQHLIKTTSIQRGISIQKSLALLNILFKYIQYIPFGKYYTSDNFQLNSVITQTKLAIG